MQAKQTGNPIFGYFFTGILVLLAGYFTYKAYRGIFWGISWLVRTMRRSRQRLSWIVPFFFLSGLFIALIFFW